jgi:O-antigen ligase
MNPHTLLACVTALFVAVSLFSHTVAARMLLLAAGLVLAGVVLMRSRAGPERVQPLPPIWIPFVLWAGWALLSLTWSIELEDSFKEFRNEAFYTGAGLWICYVGAQARHARLVLGVVAAAALVACALAIGYFGRGFAAYQHGFHGGPGNHSSALLTLMPCAVVAGWYAARAGWPRWTKFCAWALAALFLVSAYTTLNRTVWLGFAVQAIVLAALVLQRGAVPSARAKRVLAGLALAALAASAAMIVSIQAEREALGFGRPLEKDTRLVLWPEIVERVGERPLTGYGFGRGLLRASLRDELGQIDKFLWHAHNLFLEALVQTGVPGLLLLVLLLAAVARAGWRLAREADEARAACGIALLGVLAGMLVRNMTDTLLVRQNALVFWGVVGLLLGLAVNGARGIPAPSR